MGLWDFLPGTSGTITPTGPNASKNKKPSTRAKLQHNQQLRDLSLQGLRDAQNRQAPQAGYTRVAPVAQTGAAAINMAPQGDWRARELALADRITGVANGTQLGAGEIAVRREGNRALAQQQSFARAQRGGGAALAARGATMNSANIGLNVAGQAGQARTQDQQIANQTLAGVLGQGRGADIGLATSQAGFQQQTNLQNMDAKNQAIFQQAGLNQATSLANMQARLSTMGMNDQAQLAYLSQLFGIDAVELQARLQREQIKSGAKGGGNSILPGLLTVGGTIIGGIYGGPGGAVAGGTAGSAVGKGLE